MIDILEIQIGAIYEFLAHVPRDPLVSLSAQILRDAAECELARASWPRRHSSQRPVRASSWSPSEPRRSRA